ncbi:MAG: peptidylprolyl isomerase [candidate division WOR-3 bacterium]
MLRKIGLVVIIVGCLFSIESCKKDKGQREKIVAKVGKTYLTVDDFIEIYPPQLLIQAPKNYRKALIENWVNNEIIYREALKKGVHKRPEIQKRIDRIKKQLVTTSYLQDLLEKEQFVSELEARAYFEKHKEEFSTVIEISHISSNSREKAEKILSELKSGKNFAELAKKYSTDGESSSNGGYLGTFRMGELSNYPLFERAAFSLKKPGEISPVLETEFNYDIIKLHSRKEIPVEYEKVANTIISKLRIEKIQTRIEKLSDSLRKIYPYEVFPEVLEEELGVPSVLPKEEKSESLK